MAQTSLTPVLHDIADHLDELAQVLHGEFDALTNNDMEAIQQAADAKSRLTDLLNDLENERTTLLRSAGLDLNKTGVMAYLMRHDSGQPSELTALWQKIEQLTRSCEKQNKINGVIIEKNRRRTEAAMNILRGQPTDNELYSSAGSKVTNRQQQSLAKA